MTRKLVPILVLLSFALAAFGQTLPQGVRKMASMGGITEYDFQNGLKVLLFPDADLFMTYLIMALVLLFRPKGLLGGH